jgi:hypothetical protein
MILTRRNVIRLRAAAAAGLALSGRGTEGSSVFSRALETDAVGSLPVSPGIRFLQNGGEDFRSEFNGDERQFK